MIFTISEILSGLIRIGVNLTNKQNELLKWRMSPDAQKYYTEQENIDFYKALSKGDISVVDAIRKEKQQRINQMVQELLSIVMICLLSLCTSCTMFHSPLNNVPVIEQKYNTQSLQEKDKTYKLEEQPVKVENVKAPVLFKGDWFVVPEDFIKTCNENQDKLLKALEKTKEIKEHAESKEKINMYIMGGVILLCLLMVISSFIRRGGKT